MASYMETTAPQSSSNCYDPQVVECRTANSPLSIAVGHENRWPNRPAVFGELMTPIEAAQYLRLDETGTHTPASAVRTLNYWRDKRLLKATKFARHVWYRRVELDRFLELKTEQ